MTENDLKEFDALAERWSQAHERMIAMMLLPCLIAAAVAHFVSRTQAGIPRAQACDELARQICELAERYPSMRTSIYGMARDVARHGSGA